MRQVQLVGKHSNMQAPLNATDPYTGESWGAVLHANWEAKRGANRGANEGARFMQPLPARKQALP
jgi:hypothetical protein